MCCYTDWVLTLVTTISWPLDCHRRQPKKKFHWPQEHSDVVQKLLRKARQRTKVVYIPGNHDEAARQYLGVNFGDISIKAEDIHETVDGLRFWVVYGDHRRLWPVCDAS